MSYFQGFVIAVPTANKEAFRTHAEMADGAFLEHGALRVVECWGEDVPEGEVTDFRRAVKAGADETVVFSFIEWPDRATWEAAAAALEPIMETDPRFSAETNPMPFDGKRMIYGGFAALVDMR
jgi:uncharacterized protein YbaA (DUF1428 family)